MEKNLLSNVLTVMVKFGIKMIWSDFDINYFYVIRASKEGYFTLEEILNLKEDYSPEIKLNLIPLPGDLKIDSDQSPIEVILDNVFQGETPLIIENIDCK